MCRTIQAASLSAITTISSACASPSEATASVVEWRNRYDVKPGGTEDDLKRDAEACLPSRYRLLRTGLIGAGSEGKGLPHSQCMKFKGYTVKDNATAPR
jgi:hypothetical protein